MAHHSSNPDEQMKRVFEEMRERFGLGPTGQFPQGKLTSADEGEIRIAVGRQDGKVVIHFGKAIEWIGFDTKQARDIAASIMHHVSALEGRDDADGR